MFRGQQVHVRLAVQSKPRPRTRIDEQINDNVAKLQTVAQHLVEGSFEAETTDYEDHTFSGRL